jgi:hypothetical protein
MYKITILPADFYGCGTWFVTSYWGYRFNTNSQLQEDCYLLGCSTVMMMEAASTSEALVNLYQTTRCYNPEDSNLHTHRRENLKSYLVSYRFNTNSQLPWKLKICRVLLCFLLCCINCLIYTESNEMGKARMLSTYGFGRRRPISVWR